MENRVVYPKHRPGAPYARRDYPSGCGPRAMRRFVAYPKRRPGIYGVRDYPPGLGPPAVGGVCVHDISQTKEDMAIRAINDIDQERPQPFIYVTSMKHSDQFVQTTPMGCRCTSKCKGRKCKCIKRNEEGNPYNDDGTAIRAYRMLYECGPSCSCPLSCTTRVSQFGIKLELEVFKTKSRGWGVRSPKSIASGSFICEYLGELLEKKEAYLRNNDEYLFDIGDKDKKGLPRDTESEVAFTIDAKEYGNVARFINNSCSPNVYAQDVVFDNADIRVPHIMFFASKRDIPPFEELTFDYNYKIDSVFDSDGKILMKDCHCGSAKCRGRLY